MALKPGDTLLNGQYRIIQQLGRGGFGFVYLAHDMLLGEQVAIKELIPALVGDETILKRFLTEAKATMRLTHERIVRTYNVFQEGGSYYIAMEYMGGGSLGDRLRQQGPMPVEEAVRIIAQVCEGLDYAHQRGVVHCDLKPANILFTASGEAKVADFGIAHISDQLVERTWHTRAGFVAGTLAYMSPEQANGVRDDPRIDVYALGAVLYRMLTGRPYLQFDTRDTPAAQAENVMRIRTQRTVPPSKYNPRVPAWLDRVTLKALTKDVDDRFASTAQLRDALLRQGQGVAAPAAPRPRRRRPSPPPVTQPPPPTPPRATPTPLPSAPAAERKTPLLVWLLIGGSVLFCLVAIVALVIGLGGGDGGGRTTVVVVTPPSQTTPTPAVVIVTSTPLPVQPSPTPPPVLPSPTPPQARVLLYEDDFEDVTSGWEINNDEDGWLGYTNGEYAINVDSPGIAIWGTSEIGPELSDFEAEVDVRASDGPLDNSLGLVVRYRVDPKAFYWFRIGSDGYYQVVKLDGDQLSPLTDWNASDAIIQGLGVTNHLRVVCDGPNLSFYVNGTHLVDVVDDLSSVGRIGLAAGSFDEGGVLVYFDNLKVYSLQQ